MTRLFKFTSILILFCMLSACAASAAAKTNIVQLSAQDAGKTVALKAGDFLDIQLEGNPSTGYTWESANPDLKFIKAAGDAEVLPAKSKLIGAAQMMVLHFSAATPGQETLKLIYHRSWEKDTQPAKTFEVTIVVK